MIKTRKYYAINCTVAAGGREFTNLALKGTRIARTNSVNGSGE
jgi:hypothetical protein